MDKISLNEYKKKLLLLTEKENKMRAIYLRDLSLGKIAGPVTGYASIDKPWLKYYNENNLNIQRDNCSAYEYMKKQNEKELDDIALSYMNLEVTYKELLENIEKSTKALIALGITLGDTVTILTLTIPENIYLLYALNRIGAIANIVDPRLKGDELKEIINQTDSKILVANNPLITDETINKLKENTNLRTIILMDPLESLRKEKVIDKYISIKEKLQKKYKNNFVLKYQTFIANGNKTILSNLPKTTEEMPAIMVRTGGTTGKPKTVILSNKNLNEMAKQHHLGEYNFKRQDKFLNFLPPFIAYGICCATHMPLVLGLNIRLIPIFDAKSFPKLMKKYQPNIVFGGPILYEKMMNSKYTKNLDLSNFKIPVSGGDTMNIELEKKVNNYFKKNNAPHIIGQGYGMTEASSSVCYSKENSYALGSVGIPLIDNTIAIFDPETFEEKRIGEEGEVCIKTDTTMYGYLNNQEEFEKVIKTHSDGSIWLHTGDIGKMNNSGNLYIIGRIKRIIVSNGNKIFPTTIENIILKNPQVSSCSVVGVSHKTLRKVPVANIVLKDKNTDIRKLVNELNQEIKRELPEFYLPQIYIFKKELPYTSINKIDYKKLEEEKYSFTNKIIIEKNKKLIKRRI